MYVKKYTRYAPIKMLTFTKCWLLFIYIRDLSSIFFKLDGYYNQGSGCMHAD